MHVIVVGSGRVGSRLAMSLSEEGHDVVVIDDNEEAFARLGGTFNGVTVRGPGFDEQVLHEAGADRADALAAVTGFDNVNLMVAEVARRVFGVRQVVARVKEPGRQTIYNRLDVDSVCATALAAEQIMNKLRSGHEHHLLSFDGVELVHFRAGAAVEGQTIDDVEKGHQFRVCAVTRGDSTFLPVSTSKLREGDAVVGAVLGRSLVGIEELMED